MKGKLGPAKRFGTRYGATLKHKLAKIESLQKSKHKCPSCCKPAVKRVSYGIWSCHACGHKFTSRAYAPLPARPVVERKQSMIHEASEDFELPPEQPAKKEKAVLESTELQSQAEEEDQANQDDEVAEEVHHG